MDTSRRQVGALAAIPPLFEASAGLSFAGNVVMPGLVAVVCLVTGISLSGHAPDHPKPDSIVYSLNADENSAAWITCDRTVDNWTRQFLQQNAQTREPQQKYLAGFARPLLSAKAPVLPLSAPVLENIEHTQDGSIHRMKFRIRSQRNADALSLRSADDLQPVSLRVAGRDVPLHKGERFGLTWYGLGNGGLDLELAITGPSVSFWLMDSSNHLPTDVPSRPADRVAWESSDITLVCRKYTF